MPQKIKKYLSLREIGRILKIPPSSLVYYRDRFEQYIPSLEQRGGRRRYTRDSIVVFKRIRSGFRQKWPAEQIEEELAALGQKASPEITSAMDAAPGQDKPEPMTDPGQLAQMAAYFTKLTETLDRQGRLLNELEHLRGELQALRREKQRSEDDHRSRIAALEQTLNHLKQEQKQTAEHQTRSQRNHQPGGEPPEDFLSNPLTVHFPPERYLGIRDNRNQPLTLRQLIGTIRRRASGNKAAFFSWERADEGWTLVTALRYPSEKRERKFVLTAQKTLTPQGNNVTQVVRMVLEDRELSRDELLKFFKLYRSSLDQPDF